MNSAARAFLASLLIAGGGQAASASASCDREQIADHVLQQFAVYGPLSQRAEYFGFIYRSGDTLQSAVMRGPRCGRGECVMQVARAGRLIPEGATVVGEWHTHPHRGSPDLSDHDVLGAHRNRHVKCYLAFYSDPDGEVFAWNTDDATVTKAMASRLHIGSYGVRREAAAARSRQASTASAAASFRE